MRDSTAKRSFSHRGTEFLNFSLLFSLCAYYPVDCGRTGFCSGLMRIKSVSAIRVGSYAVLVASNKFYTKAGDTSRETGDGLPTIQI